MLSKVPKFIAPMEFPGPTGSVVNTEVIEVKSFPHPKLVPKSLESYFIEQTDIVPGVSVGVKTFNGN